MMESSEKHKTNEGISPDNSRHLRLDNLTLHYLEYGKGDIHVVMIPGITSPAMTWGFVARELAAHYHVYTLDNRGRGLSDKPASGYRLSDYTSDVLGFIDKLALKQPLIVLGHSMGARIAACFGASYSERATALILADPPVSGPGRAPYPYPLDFYLDQLRKARRGSTVEDLRPFLPTWSDEQLEDRVQWLATCDHRAIVESYRSLNEEDFFDFWSKIDLPALLIYGEKSTVVPEPAVAELHRTNPAAEIIAVPAAGHMIPWDNLRDFLTAVNRFIRAVAEN